MHHHHRQHPRALLAAVVVITAVVGVTLARPGTARACECGIESPARSVLDAHTIVRGRTLEYVDLSPSEEEIDRRWTYEVDERYRGDTPAVIGVRVQVPLGDCSDTVTRLPPLMLLPAPDAGGVYRYDGCTWEPSPTDLEPFVDDVWPISGRGPPAAVAAAPTADHTMVVVDADGAPLGYLPSTGPTLALAACPEGTHFLQLRSLSWAGGGVALARWRLDTWEEVGVVAVTTSPDLNPTYGGRTLTCSNPSGTSAFLLGPEPLQIVNSEVTPAEVESDFLAPGVGGLALTASSSEAVEVRSVDPLVESVVVPVELPYGSARSVTLRADGWQLGSVVIEYPRDVPEYAVATADIALDGTLTVGERRPIAIPVWPMAAIAVDGAGAVPAAEAPPTPLLSERGRLIDGPTPTLATLPPPVATTGPAPTTAPTTLAPVISDDGDGSAVGWAVGGGLAALTILAIVWAVVRRRARGAA